MSPSARGLVPGLFLAVVAAVGVLAANGHWLLPSLDETGVRYLLASPDVARGRPPSVPIAAWDALAPTTGLEGEGKVLPLAMAIGIRAGAKPFVAGLWAMAGAAGLAALACAWVTGGVAGVPGALVAGALLLASPLTVEAATALTPDLVVAALVLLLLGTLTYRPTWSIAHGALAAAAWLAGPAGLGAVGAVLLWPLVRRRRGGVAIRDLALGAAPPIALMATALRHPLMTPPAWAWSGAEARRVASGITGWVAPGADGMTGLAFGLMVGAAATVLLLREARSAPRPQGPVRWDDPAAADGLAVSFRPAALLLFAAVVVGALGAGAERPLARPWLPATSILCAAVGAAAWRWHARHRGRVGGWVPLVALALWMTLGGWRAARALAAIREAGRGVTAKVWVASPVIRWIDNNAPPGLTIYASDPALVVLQSGHGARTLPATDVSLDRFVEHFAGHPGAIVLTGGDALDARAAALRARLSLREAVRAQEGRVLVPGG